MSIPDQEPKRWLKREKETLSTGLPDMHRSRPKKDGPGPGFYLFNRKYPLMLGKSATCTEYQ